MDEQQFRAIWRTLDRSRRKQILNAVQGGRRLEHPIDAEIAAHIARRDQNSNWIFLALPFVVAAVIFGVRFAAGSTPITSLLAGILAGSTAAVFAIPAWFKWKSALSKATRANDDKTIM